MEIFRLLLEYVRNLLIGLQTSLFRLYCVKKSSLIALLSSQFPALSKHKIDCFCLKEQSPNILLIILLSFLITFIQAQEPTHYSFNELYDFNEDVIYDIHHDSKGLIWIATGNGLYNFDGQHFKNHINSNFDVSYGNISEDTEGRIWCQNFKGQLFYINKDSLNIFHDYSSQIGNYLSYDVSTFPNIITSGKNSISQKEFYNDTTNVIMELMPEQGFNIFFSEDFELLNGWIYFYFIKYNIASHLRQLKIMKTNGIESIEIASYDLSNGGPFNKIESYNGAAYILHRSNSFISLYKIKESCKEYFHLKNSEFISFQNFRVDSKEEIQLMTKSGILLMDTLGNIKNKKPWFEYNSISFIKEDREGNTWIGTLNNGLLVIPSIVAKTIKLTDLEIKRSVIDDDGEVYIIDSGNTLKIISNNLEETTTIPYPEKNLKVLTFNKYKKNVAASDVEIIKKGKGEYIQKTGSIHPAVPWYRQLFFIDKNTYIKVGEATRLFRFENNGRIKKHIPPKIKNLSLIERLDSTNIIPIRKKNAYRIAQDKKSNNIFISYVDGLFRHDLYEKNNPTKEILFNGKTINAFSILSDQNTGIWVSTSDRALLRVENDSVVFHENLEHSASKMAQWKNFLFLSSGNNIIKYDTVKKTKEKINYLDGLKKEKIVNIYVFNDTLKIVSKKHLTNIPCNHNFSNLIAPLFFFKNLELNGKEIPPKENYRFAYNENDIKVSFGAISYRSQKNYTYEYRMKGISDKWIVLNSKTPHVSFRNILPGDYVLDARACNEDGVCSESETIYFSIQKPFYQRIWFYILLVLFTIAIVTFFSYLKIRNAKQKAQFIHEREVLQKEVYKSKIAAFRSQMNPHFIFNALNTIQDFIISNEKNIASEYLSDFADLIRSYLKQSKEGDITLQEEIDTLSLYLKLEKMRFEDDFNFEINYDTSLNTTTTNIPVMLLQPFIENSIKHGLLHKDGKKQLSIKFYTKQSSLYCIIQDNGIGIKASSLINNTNFHHQSFATSAIQERINLMNSNREEKISIKTINLHDEKGAPCGTRVIVQIPLDY